MWVNTKSKSYKAFVSFLVAILLVFSYEVNKPKAVVPILAWGAWAIAGIVAEEAIEMGVRHYTADGKTATKSKTKKIADEIFESYGDYGFDFLKSNPTRKADGSLVFNPSANDRAKIARKIADEFGDVLGVGLGGAVALGESNEGIYATDDGQAIEVEWSPYMNGPTHTNATNYLEYMYEIDFDRMSDTTMGMNLVSKVTGKTTYVRAYPSGYVGSPKLYNFTTYDGNDIPFKTIPLTLTDNPYATRFESPVYNDSPPFSDRTTLTVYSNVVGHIGDLMFEDGMMIPKSVRNTYPAPPNMSPTQRLPNYDDLSNKPVVLKNIYPVSQSDTEISYETINNDYETDNSISNKFEQNVDTYLENGDVNQNTYNTQTINNYYTDSQYPVKSGDITIIIDNEVVVPPDDDGDDGTTVHNPHVEHVEELNQGMFAVMKNSYDYLGDSLDNALLAMKDVTDDATGIIVYLDTAFDWLPSQWRALFGSAFVLGIFAHFFRR